MFLCPIQRHSFREEAELRLETNGNRLRDDLKEKTTYGICTEYVLYLQRRDGVREMIYQRKNKDYERYIIENKWKSEGKNSPVYLTISNHYLRGRVHLQQ